MPEQLSKIDILWHGETLELLAEKEFIGQKKKSFLWQILILGKQQPLEKWVFQYQSHQLRMTVIDYYKCLNLPELKNWFF